MRRHRTAALAALAAALAVAPPAAAHVTVSPGEATAGGYALLDFTVPHGCEESPTTSIAVKLPEGVNAATPEAVPGWTVAKRMQTLDPPAPDGHGGAIPERVDTVTWTGGPLPSDQLTRFALSVRMPDAAGETLAFPVVQTCEQGQTGWIEVAADGEDPEALEHPAPLVALVAGGEGDAAAEADPGPSSGRVDAALGLGAGGLALGLVALGVAVAGRRRGA